VQKYFPRIVLMLGNVVVGMTILGPAGMLAELATGLGVGIHDTGLLVTYGAVVLCIGSPMMAWLTTRIDRRVLLVVTLAVLAIGQGLSALTPNYSVILLLRVIMLAIGALYTPQAATTVALIVPDRERPSAIAFVFLGWSIAIAGGLPLVTVVATNFGWQTVYGALAVFASIIAALLFAALPKGLKGAPLSPRSFVAIAENNRIMLILLVTLLQTCGQFAVFVYLAPLLNALTGAGAAITGGFFAFYGVIGLIGNVVASSIVTALGTQRTLALFLGSMLLGMTLWATGVGWLPAMGAGVFFWGVRIFGGQFLAAGSTRRGRAGSCERVSRAQYIAALRRTGDRVRHRRASVRPRIFSCHWFRRRRFCDSRMHSSCGLLGIRFLEAEMRSRFHVPVISSLPRLSRS
jgi:MFS transporter, DHA1 family, inner membrane transport protein